MPRYKESAPMGAGVSQVLRRAGFAKSSRIRPKDRSDQRMSAGFVCSQPGAKTDMTVPVIVHHYLGNRHGIANEADRIAKVHEMLDLYLAEFVKDGRFDVVKVGDNTDAHISISARPDPVVGETLRHAAEQLHKLGGAAANVATSLREWAALADEGKDW